MQGDRLPYSVRTLRWHLLFQTKFASGVGTVHFKAISARMGRNELKAVQKGPAVDSRKTVLSGLEALDDRHWRGCLYDPGQLESRPGIELAIFFLRTFPAAPCEDQHLQIEKLGRIGRIT